MGKQDEFFKMYGAKELGRELRKLSRGTQNKIIRPGLTKGAAEIRKDAKKKVSGEILKRGETGGLFKAIKSKTFTKKRGGRGLVSRIGIIPATQTNSKGQIINKYAGYWNKRRKFLDKALDDADDKATKVLIDTVQEKLTAFHAKEGDKGKRR